MTEPSVTRRRTGRPSRSSRPRTRPITSSRPRQRPMSPWARASGSAVDANFGGGAQPGSGNGTPSLTASNVELVPASGSSQGQGPGAFGMGGLTGTVATVGDGSIGITTSNGQTLDVVTSADTTYTRQADASASAVSPGVAVRITTAGGFPGGGFPGGGQPPTGSFNRARQGVGPPSPPRTSRSCSTKGNDPPPSHQERPRTLIGQVLIGSSGDSQPSVRASAPGGG